MHTIQRIKDKSFVIISLDTEEAFNKSTFFQNKDTLIAQMVKNLPAMPETQVWSLGREDPLEKQIATHSSTPAWRIPWPEGLVGYSPRGHKELTTAEWQTRTTNKGEERFSIW